MQRPIYTEPPAKPPFVAPEVLPLPQDETAEDLDAAREVVMAANAAAYKEALEKADAAHAAALQQHAADWAASLAKWEAARYAAEEQAPRHACCGPWLKANPTKGVECVDRQDGLGPRLVGWPEGMDYPNLEAFAAERQAVADKADADAKESLSARQKARAELDAATTVVGIRTAVAALIDDIEVRLAKFAGAKDA